MQALPSAIVTLGWSWQTYPVADEQRGTFWIGSDPHGRKWLTKLRGSFAAYREIAFASLATRLGWSCQSSTYIVLDAESANLLGRTEHEVHCAHTYMLEHSKHSCLNRHCPVPILQGRTLGHLSDFDVEGLERVYDRPKSQIASCIFGALEQSDFLVTANHEVVIIDSELMFSSSPCEIDSYTWLRGGIEKADRFTQTFVADVCEEVGSLSARDVDLALALPSGIDVDQFWPIRPIVERGIQFARELAPYL